MTPAQKAAAEIKDALLAWAKAIGHVMPLPPTFDSLNTSIIQSALDAAVEQLKQREIKMVARWRESAHIRAVHKLGPEYAEFDKGVARGELACASELESLAKEK